MHIVVHKYAEKPLKRVARLPFHPRVVNNQDHLNQTPLPPETPEYSAEQDASR
jgi:hypothetical protein